MSAASPAAAGALPALPAPAPAFAPEITAFLAQLQPGDGSAPTFTPKGGAPDIWLTPTEEAVFATVRAVCERYSIQHATPRVAGGWVRDKVLGRASDDIDIALEHMDGETFARYVTCYFAELHQEKSQKAAELGPSGDDAAASDKSTTMSRVGVIKSNPAKSKHLSTATFVLHGLSIDCSNMRTEVYRNDSRIPLVQMGSPRDDVMRRDFTLNSLFYNILARRVEDACGTGVLDLRRGVLRAPLPAFKTFFDDPLRVLRCARFSARFRFRVSAEIEHAAAHPSVHKSVLRKISRERMGKEIGKMLTEFGAVPLAFAYLCRWGLRPIVFAPPEPELLPPSVAAAANAAAAGDGKGASGKGAKGASGGKAGGGANAEPPQVYCPVTIDPALAAEFPLFHSHEVVHRLVLAALAPTALEKLSSSPCTPARAPGSSAPGSSAPGSVPGSSAPGSSAASPAEGCVVGGAYTQLSRSNLSEDTLLTSYCWRLMDSLHTLLLRRYPRTFRAAHHPTKEEVLAALGAGAGAAMGAETGAAAGATMGDDEPAASATAASLAATSAADDDSNRLVSLSSSSRDSFSYQQPQVVCDFGAILPALRDEAAGVLTVSTAPLRARQRVFLSAGPALVASKHHDHVPLWAPVAGTELGGEEQAEAAMRALLKHVHVVRAEAEAAASAPHAASSAGSADADRASEWAPSELSLSMSLLAAFLFPFFGRRVRGPRGRFKSLVCHIVINSLNLYAAEDAAIATIQQAAHRLRALAAEYAELRERDVFEWDTKDDDKDIRITMSEFGPAFSASVAAWRNKLCLAVAAAGPHLDAALALAEAAAGVSQGPVPYVAPLRKYRPPGVYRPRGVLPAVAASNHVASGASEEATPAAAAAEAGSAASLPPPGLSHELSHQIAPSPATTPTSTPAGTPAASPAASPALAPVPAPAPASAAVTGAGGLNLPSLQLPAPSTDAAAAEAAEAAGAAEAAEATPQAMGCSGLSSPLLCSPTHAAFPHSIASPSAQAPAAGALRWVPLVGVGYQSVPSASFTAPAPSPASPLSSSAAAAAADAAAGVSGAAPGLASPPGSPGLLAAADEASAQADLNAAAGASAPKRGRPAPPARRRALGTAGLLAGHEGSVSERCPLPDNYGQSHARMSDVPLSVEQMSAAGVRALAVYIYSPWGCHLPTGSSNSSASALSSAASSHAALPLGAHPYGAPAPKAELSGAEVREIMATTEQRVEGRMLGQILEKLHEMSRRFPFASKEDATKYLHAQYRTN